MNGWLQNLFGGEETDPYSPRPPTFQEILFRALGASLPPPGYLKVPNTFGGRVMGGAARLTSGVANVIGGEMERRRLDPLSRVLAAGEAGVEAASRVRVPVPGLPKQLPGYPGIPPSYARGLESAYGGEPENVVTLPELAPTERLPRNMQELMRYAEGPDRKRILASQLLTKLPEDMFVSKPVLPHFATPGSVAVDPYTSQPMYQIPAQTKIEHRMRPIQLPGEPYATLEAEFQELTDPISGQIIERKEVPGTRRSIHQPQTEAQKEMDALRAKSLKQLIADRERRITGTMTLKEAEDRYDRIHTRMVRESETLGIEPDPELIRQLEETRDYIDKKRQEQGLPTTPGRPRGTKAPPPKRGVSEAEKKLRRRYDLPEG